MSKSNELINKQLPVNTGNLLGMAASLAAAALHVYTYQPDEKISQLFATEAIPPVRQTILPIVQEALQLAESDDAEADEFLEIVMKTVSLLDEASRRAVELGLTNEKPEQFIQ